MLWDGADACAVIDVCHVESLDATVVQDRPYFDHSLAISRDEAV
jgi:hypothetical protein